MGQRIDQLQAERRTLAKVDVGRKSHAIITHTHAIPVCRLAHAHFKDSLTVIDEGILQRIRHQFVDHQTTWDRLVEIKGDVIDQTLLTTRLAEIAPVGGAAQYTGRSLTLPNSLFLIHPIANGSVLDDFVLHTVVIPLAGDKDWRRAETSLLAAANEVCAPYMSEAQSQFDRHAQTYGLEGTELEPRVSIALPDPTRIDLQLRIATPARKTRRIEQQIVRSYLARAAADTPDPETDVNVPSN